MDDNKAICPYCGSVEEENTVINSANESNAVNNVADNFGYTQMGAQNNQYNRYNGAPANNINVNSRLSELGGAFGEGVSTNMKQAEKSVFFGISTLILAITFCMLMFVGMIAINKDGSSSNGHKNVPLGDEDVWFNKTTNRLGREEADFDSPRSLVNFISVFYDESTESLQIKENYENKFFAGASRDDEDYVQLRSEIAGVQAGMVLVTPLALMVVLTFIVAFVCFISLCGIKRDKGLSTAYKASRKLSTCIFVTTILYLLLVIYTIFSGVPILPSVWMYVLLVLIIVEKFVILPKVK